MKDYIVRYSLGGYVYETEVRTSSSGAAIFWVATVINHSTDISVVNND